MLLILRGKHAEDFKDGLVEACNISGMVPQKGMSIVQYRYSH